MGYVSLQEGKSKEIVNMVCDNQYTDKLLCKPNQKNV